jgi:hypothetical protein
MGLAVPADFPSANHERLNVRVAPRQPTQPEIYAEYAGGWNGVVYRFCESAQHDEAFRAWFRRAGASPVPENRYRQETHLFVFFVAGLATLESFSYMAHALGAFIDATNFPMTTATQKRGVSPSATAQRFLSSAYSTEPLAVRLNTLIATSEFKAWSDVRNVLAHRISPARNFNVGGPRHGTADWMGLGTLTAASTQNRRIWLAQQLSALVEVAADFADAHL